MKIRQIAKTKKKKYNIGKPYDKTRGSKITKKQAASSTVRRYFLKDCIIVEPSHSFIQRGPYTLSRKYACLASLSTAQTDEY